MSAVTNAWEIPLLRSQVSIWDDRVYMAVVAMPGEGRHVWAIGVQLQDGSRHIVNCGNPRLFEAHAAMWRDLGNLWPVDTENPTQLVVASTRVVDALRMATQILARDKGTPEGDVARMVAWYCWRAEYEGSQVVVPIMDRCRRTLGLPAGTDADDICQAMNVDLIDRDCRIPKQRGQVVFGDAGDELHTASEIEHAFLYKEVTSARGERGRSSQVKSTIRPVLTEILHKRLDRLVRVTEAAQEQFPTGLPDLPIMEDLDRREWTQFHKWGFPRQVLDLEARSWQSERWAVSLLADDSLADAAIEEGKVLVGNYVGDELITKQAVTRARVGGKWWHPESNTAAKVVAINATPNQTRIQFEGPLPQGFLRILPEPANQGQFRSGEIRMSQRLREPHWMRGSQQTPKAVTSALTGDDLLSRVWELRGRPRPSKSSNRATRQANQAIADVLEAVSAQHPAVCVPAPPGAGKSWLVEGIAALAADAGQRVLILTQTTSQAQDLTRRLTSGFASINVTLLHAAGNPPVLDVDAVMVSKPSELSDQPGVVIATASKGQWMNPQDWQADLGIVDEAWQMTWGQLQIVAGLAPRWAVVGDAMQLPPVTVADVRRWHNRRFAPHRPAPIVMMEELADHTTIVPLPSTRRFGPDTAELLSDAFYPQGTGFGSLTAPDLSPRLESWPQQEFSSIRVPLNQVVATAARVASQAADAGLDVGVVAPHVAIVADLQGQLSAGIPVDTTERWQGLEADLVVVVHPLACEEPSGFEMQAGRMCVAMSRHRNRVVVIEPDNLAEQMVLASASQADSPGLLAHLRIQEALTQPDHGP